MKQLLFFRSRKRLVVSLVVIALVVTLLPMINIRVQAAGANNDTQAQIDSLDATTTFVRGVHVPTTYTTGNNAIPIPPTDQFCRKNFNFPCYSPQEMQNAYGLTSLINKGYNGKGQTIEIGRAHV